MATTAKKKSKQSKKSLATPWWRRALQISLTLIVLLILGCYTASAQQAAEAEQSFAAGRHDQAVDQLHVSTQIFPVFSRDDQLNRMIEAQQSSQAYTDGLAAFQQQQWQLAEQSFRQVIARDTAYPTAQSYLRQLQSRQQPEAPVQLTQISQLPGLEVGLDAAGQLQVPILMYHYISENLDPDDELRTELSVSPAVFAEQMQYLTDHGYHPVSLQQVTETLQGNALLPPKPVVLTFDDGYLDFYQNAYPILFKHQFKATLFVITDLTSYNAKYTTWDQLKLMAAGGLIEVGSHTQTHPDLRQISNEQIIRELSQSKQLLETQLGNTVGMLSYPIGSHDQRVAEAARVAGYVAAVTTETGSWHRPDALMTMPRIRIKNQPMSNYLAE